MLTGGNEEEISGTAVTLSCVITDITELAAVVWSKSDVADLSSESGYTVVQGTYGSNTQTTTLALTTAVNTADTTYTCKVTPDGGTEGQITMESNVFGEHTFKSTPKTFCKYESSLISAFLEIIIFGTVTVLFLIALPKFMVVYSPLAHAVGSLILLSI